MKNRKKFLTIEEKMEMVKSGKTAPICYQEKSSRNGFVVKIRGSIFDGVLSRKNIKL